MFDDVSAFPLTPADTSGIVDVNAMARLVDRLRDAGVGSVGLLGSTGAYAYLSRAERNRAVAAAVEAAAGQVPIMVGVSALRTDDAQQLARDARAAGADALLLAPMSYTPLVDEEVYQHVVAIAQAGELPLCIYNNPTTTRFTFGPALLARLAETANIRAVKMPAKEAGEAATELRELREVLPPDFRIGYSGDWFAAEALLAGADCWFSVVAGLLPTPAMQICKAAGAGNRLEVERLQAACQPLWALFKAFGSFRVVYAMADMLSLCRADPPRPVLPLPLNERSRLAEAMQVFQTP